MQLYSQPPRQSLTPTVIPDDVPVYKIKAGKFYADEELFEEGSIIVWPEEPNLDMEPINELARQAHKAYRQKLDDFGREVAKANGKAFISQDQAFENSYLLAKNEGKRVTLLNGKDEVPILGTSKKGPKKARQIIPNATEPTVPVMAGKKSTYHEDFV